MIYGHMIISQYILQIKKNLFFGNILVKTIRIFIFGPTPPRAHYAINPGSESVISLPGADTVISTLHSQCDRNPSHDVDT